MENWKSIRLELAPTEQFPTGSVSRGYLIRLPLGDGDTIDRSAFEQRPYKATVRRYWSSEPDEGGQVLNIEGKWAIRCDGTPDRLLGVDGKPLRLGQQLSTIEPDGTILPFRIASIR